SLERRARFKDARLVVPAGEQGTHGNLGALGAAEQVRDGTAARGTEKIVCGHVERAPRHGPEVPGRREQSAGVRAAPTPPRRPPSDPRARGREGGWSRRGMRGRLADPLVSVGAGQHDEEAPTENNAAEGGRQRPPQRDRKGHDPDVANRHHHARPPASSTPKARCRRAVAARAAFSTGPSRERSTARSGAAASGTLSHATSGPGLDSASATAATSRNATATVPAYSDCPTGRPSCTTSVRLPARASLSTSRTLLTRRMAVASRPTGSDARRPMPLTRPAWSSSVPQTASGPKNRKTNGSPSAW